jgi:hypothetical protein
MIGVAQRLDPLLHQRGPATVMRTPVLATVTFSTVHKARSAVVTSRAFAFGVKGYSGVYCTDTAQRPLPIRTIHASVLYFYFVG